MANFDESEAWYMSPEEVQSIECWAADFDQHQIGFQESIRVTHQNSARTAQASGALALTGVAFAEISRGFLDNDNLSSATIGGYIAMFAGISFVGAASTLAYSLFDHRRARHDQAFVRQLFSEH